MHKSFFASSYHSMVITLFLHKNRSSNLSLSNLLRRTGTMLFAFDMQLTKHPPLVNARATHQGFVSTTNPYQYPALLAQGCVVSGFTKNKYEKTSVDATLPSTEQCAMCHPSENIDLLAYASDLTTHTETASSYYPQVRLLLTRIYVTGMASANVLGKRLQGDSYPGQKSGILF